MFSLLKNITATGVIFFSVVSTAMAQVTSPGPGGQSGSFQNPLKFTSLDQFLTGLLEVIIQIGFPLVVLAIIWTGFLFVKAQGDVTELKTAKQAFFWTLIGALLVLGAFVLSELIQSTVNEIT